MSDSLVACITGATSGIGRAFAEAYAKLGYDLILIGRRQALLEKNAQFFEEHYHVFCQCLFLDLASADAIDTLSEKLRSTTVDVLINNACLHRQRLLASCSCEDFNYVLRVGVTAPYMLTQLFLPYFRDGASVVNITSTRAFMSQADTESYSAAKGGISALTHAMAVSLAGRVRVNAIAPGWIDTGAYHDPAYQPNYSKADTAQHPSGRVGTPMDILRAVLFLSDRENSFIDGETLTVDGGMTRRMIYTGDEGWSYTI